MGEVWRARDTELDRQVAVKVLPESFAGDPTRLERFQREAKALAALSHPNLLDIYDVGSANGLHYAVTELLEGDTLRERITPTGLPWQKVTQIGAAVADGLAAAHGRGIVHRDLKPENLFLTADGRVKILDFGLAAIHEAASADASTATITEAGTVMGTPGYMAPEQVKGQPADTRSDIFSLGCVLYEMVSGHRAFGGDTGAEVIAAILKEEPPQLSSSGAAVPVDLERAVHRCLEKRPEARFQSAADLSYSLKNVGLTGGSPVMATPAASTMTTKTGGPHRFRWWVPVLGAGMVIAALATSWWALTRGADRGESVGNAREIVSNRIAVVPFENRTGDPSLDPIGVLAADRIGQGLAGVEPPRAVGFETGAEIVPTSRLRELIASGTATTASAVADATGARIVVTGSYVGAGKNLELDAVVTDASTGQVVHAFEPVPAPRDNPGEGVAALRDRCFIVVTDHLSPVLGVFADRQFPTIEAYKLFVSAMQHLRTGRWDDAMTLSRQALEADPDFNRVRAWLLLPSDTQENVQPKIDELRRRGDHLTENQLLLIQLKEADIRGNLETAYRIWRELTDRAPDNPMVAWFTMSAAVHTNRPGIALGLFDRFHEMIAARDNFTSNGMFAAGSQAAHLLGRYDQELAIARSWQEVLPDAVWPLTVEARALVGLGRLDEVESLVSAVEARPQAAGWAGDLMVNVSIFLRAHDHPKESLAMADRAVDWIGGGREPADNELPDYRLGLALRLTGAFEQAREIFDRLNEAQPDNRFFLTARGVTAANLGDHDTAESVNTRLRELGDPPDQRGLTAYNRACLAAQMGDRDDALRLLREAFAQGLFFSLDIRMDPDLEPLWTDPEFQEILRPKG